MINLIYNLGYDVVFLNLIGWYYYVCGVLGYCVVRNFKVKIYVNVIGDVI